MKPKKPTATQFIMLSRMAAAGGRIFREPGGFWTVEGVARTPRDTPAWSVAVGTIRSAEEAGFVRRALVHPEAWRDERVLTPEGEAAVSGPSPKLNETLRSALEHMAQHGGDFHAEELRTLGLAERRGDQWVLTPRGQLARSPALFFTRGWMVPRDKACASCRVPSLPRTRGPGDDVDVVRASCLVSACARMDQTEPSRWPREHDVSP